MTNLKFLKTLTAGVALATAFYPQAWAGDTGDCGPNCRYEYDYATRTLTYIGTGPNGSGEIGYSSMNYGLSGPVENAIISEGITSVYRGSGVITIRDIGSSNGKLVIPSTMENFGFEAAGYLKFGTIEINAKNISFTERSFSFNSGTNTNLIMSADANINFSEGAFKLNNNQAYPDSITISCKGKPDTCLAKFGNSLNSMTGTINPIYYEEYDSSGKPVEIWNENGGFKYDANGNLIEKYNTNGKIAEKYDSNGYVSAKYDLSGNLLEEYKYDSGGNLLASYKNGVATYRRTSYTPAEAAKAVRKGNNNTITFTFK